MIIYFFDIATSLNWSRELVHEHIDFNTHDMVECDAAASNSWSVQISFDVVVMRFECYPTEQLQHNCLHYCHQRRLMRLSMDHDRYDMVECGEAGQPKFDLLDLITVKTL